MTRFVPPSLDSNLPRVRRGLPRALALFATAAIWVGTAPSALATGLTIDQMNQMRRVTEVAISTDGRQVAYLVEIPRRPGYEEDGPAWRELHLAAAEGSSIRGYVTGEVRVSDPAFTPDGRHVLYLAKRGDDEDDALWAIPVDGGESRRVFAPEGGLGSYHLSPDGKTLAYLAEEPENKARKKAEEAGYDREVFEEEWRPQHLFLVGLPAFDPAPSDPEEAPAADPEPRQVELEGSVASVHWSADGSRLAVKVQPRDLVDDEYMYQRVRVLDAASGAVLAKVENPGKVGQVRLSADGRHVALVSAADWNDPREGRLMVAAVDGEGAAEGSELRDLMPEYEAHVSSIAWRDASTIVWAASEGSGSALGTVDLDGTVERLLRSSPETGVPILGRIQAALTGRLAFSGHTPTHPAEAFVYDPGARPRRLSDSNPWLPKVKLADQELVTWTASDGLELEGILVHPLDGRRPAPLLLMVHGGPEANDYHGWVTSYSRPAQVAAARGYAVFFPNYRGSTGRGVAFSKLGQGDAAGKEFQDLVEAVDHLVAEGIADRERVGVTGGSYGGYATAWCSTYYSDRFAAGVMFVGISNKSSKGFTTDIPVEDMAVHTLFEPWTKWQFSLERSPLYHASKSKTPLLIATGTGDTRVHPSQSLQLYRALSLQDKTVRFVRYPDEPHGNRRAASRDDYSRRLLRWMDHFVKEGQTGLPPVELEQTAASKAEVAK